MQRNTALAVLLRTRDFATIEAARNADFHAQRSTAHRAHHRTLHGAAEHHALFDLLRNAVRNELRIELGLPDLGNVQTHVADSHSEQLRRFQPQLLDVLALLADHDARTRRLDRNVNFLRSTLDMAAAHRCSSEAGAQETAPPPIGVDVLGKLLLAGIPLRRPVTSDTQPYAQRIDLLTHD